MSESPKEGKRNFFVAPTFHKKLKDLATSQGECLVLECRVKGVPPPQITWKREGAVIEDCPDFRMLHKGEVATLVIGEAFPEDTGIFTCEASNKAGTASTACKVVVKGGGYHTISTKQPAGSHLYGQPRPTQVLPTQQNSSHVITSQHTSSHPTQLTSSNHISRVSLTPKNPVPENKLVPEKSSDVQNLSSAATSSQSNYNKAQSLDRHNPSTISPTAMTGLMFNTAQHLNVAENQDFKEEKDELIKEVAKSFNDPQKHKQKKRTVSREVAFIQRDIELREAESPATSSQRDIELREAESPATSSQRDIELREAESPATSSNDNTIDDQDNSEKGDYILYSPTLAAILEIEPQEYRVSTFEQRLMNEIEYRLQQIRPIHENPEDGIFDNIPESQQSKPAFVTKLKNFKAMDGTATKFTCRVTAKPKAKVFWFKDGKQISKKSKHYLQRTDGEGGHELYIPQLHMEDDGNYTALATNPQGRVSSTGRLAMVSEKRKAVVNDVSSATPTISKQSLTNPRMMSPLTSSVRMTQPQTTSNGVTTSSMTSSVSPLPKIVPEKGQLADDEESPVEKYYRPSFIQKPQENTKAEEGKLVRFDVKVTGLPLPNLEWLINGKPVRQDALHKILVRENNVHSLLLERVSPMDEGQYTIKASNVAGTAVAHIQLHVAPREQLSPPAFIQRLAGHCVAEGDAFRLEARVLGTPRPIISWKRGSDQVMHDSRTQLYEDESGYVCLQITQARLSDAGWYTCSAANKAGISSCNCKLDVYAPTSNVAVTKNRIRTPHRYANLAKVAGVDMREALTPDAQAHHMLPESEDL